MASSAPVRRRISYLVAALLVTPLLRALVLVHAVESGQAWRTTCPHCDTPLAGLRSSRFRPLDRGLRSAAPAGGRCPATLPRARCGGLRVGPPPGTVELVALAVAAAVAVAVAGGGWSVAGAIALAGWAAAAVPLFFVDLAVHRLPDRLTLPAAGWVLAWLGAAAALGGTGGSWLRAVAAAAACGFGFGVIALLLGSRGYGLGDAKLALGAGALLGWHGWTTVVGGLMLAFIGSGLVAAGLLVAQRVRWRDSLPFGPFLIAGTLITLAWVGVS